MPFTVYIRNEALGQGYFCGTFATLDEAADWSKTQAAHVEIRRVFYEGTPKNWGKATGRKTRGET
jgi:hypothetical protein